MTPTLPNGDAYAETTARVEVDARIVRFYINDDGDLIVVWNYNGSDGQPYEENLGNVKGEPGVPGEPGAPGAPGEPGAPGQDGISIVKTEIINGELWITYSDGREENVGKVIGEDGKDGIDGSSAIVAGWAPPWMTRVMNPPRSRVPPLTAPVRVAPPTHVASRPPPPSASPCWLSCRSVWPPR